MLFYILYPNLYNGFCTDLLHKLSATAYDGRVSETSKGGINKMLGDAVTKAIEARGWSVRGAAAYTGLHANTVDRLKKGFGAEPEALIRFGMAVAENGREIETAKYFLKIAGKIEIIDLIEKVEIGANTTPVETNVLRPNGQTVEVKATDGTSFQFDASSENLAVIVSVMRVLKSACA